MQAMPGLHGPGGMLLLGGIWRTCTERCFSFAVSKKRAPAPTREGKIGGSSPPLHRAGGGGRRLARYVAARRLRHHDVPRSWHRACEGDEPTRLVGRALRQSHRVLPRPWRFDAHVRQRAQHARRIRHRGRPHSARGRGRLREQVPRGRQSHPLLLRRRSGEHRWVSRGSVPGSAVEAPHRLHLREQRVLDGNAAIPVDVGGRRVAQGSRLRDGSRPFFCERRPGGRAAHRRSGQTGAGAVLADLGLEALYLPFPRPLDEHDPAKYRTQAELDEHKKRDPVARSRSRLVEQGLGEARLDGLEKSVEADVADAIKFANESPAPGIADLEPATYAGPFAY